MSGLVKSMKTIGTHSGTFHCDEALGCFLLRRTAQFRDSPVTRTRDEAKLAQLDCVIDVGGVYDHAKARYDHHQRGFTETLGMGGYNTVKLSSAGLVYKHYGREVISTETGLPLDSPQVDTLYFAMYKHFVQGVDAVDNGVEMFKANVLTSSSGAKKRRTDEVDEGSEGMVADGVAEPEVQLVKQYLDETSLGHRVGALNAAWNEDASDAVQDARFEEASAMAGREFLSKLSYLHKSWLPARDIVKRAIETRREVDKSGKIIVLGQYCPWKDHLFELEEELQLPQGPDMESAEGGRHMILYCLYQDSRSGQWRIMSVPQGGAGSFSQRKPLPAHWRGLRGTELDAITTVPGGTFVHIAGFTGGHETYEGMLKMARMACTESCCCCT
mmetsp:Transcript_6243/g.13100  ORF Transcript_6243/g.13100 Transcript_6243/m.13100 type:complete len:386 (+) Transcript_6243:74-1231(+)